MFSSRGKKRWFLDLPVTKYNRSINEFTDLLVKNRRHLYRYDGNGSGCLSWCRKVVMDFAEAGLVAEEAGEIFAQFLDDVRQNKSVGYFIPEDEGIFL